MGNICNKKKPLIGKEGTKPGMIKPQRSIKEKAQTRKSKNTFGNTEFDEEKLNNYAKTYAETLYLEGSKNVSQKSPIKVPITEGLLHSDKTSNYNEGENKNYSPYVEYSRGNLNSHTKKSKNFYEENSTISNLKNALNEPLRSISEPKFEEPQTYGNVFQDPELASSLANQNASKYVRTTRKMLDVPGPSIPESQDEMPLNYKFVYSKTTEVVNSRENNDFEKNIIDQNQPNHNIFPAPGRMKIFDNKKRGIHNKPAVQPAYQTAQEVSRRFTFDPHSQFPEDIIPEDRTLKKRMLIFNK